MYFGVEFESMEAPFTANLNPLAYLKKKFTPIPFSHVLTKSQGTGPDVNHFLKWGPLHQRQHWGQYRVCCQGKGA